VSNLSALKGLPLTELNFEYTKVSDLEPLQGMKLTHLFCQHTAVSNLWPLKGMPLEYLRCDFNARRHADILRSIKTLRSINNKSAEQFWKELDGK
jgi:hypothetical protein